MADNIRKFGLGLEITGQEQAASAQAGLEAVDAAGKQAAVSASALEAQTQGLAVGADAAAAAELARARAMEESTAAESAHARAMAESAAAAQRLYDEEHKHEIALRASAEAVERLRQAEAQAAQAPLRAELDALDATVRHVMEDQERLIASDERLAAAAGRDAAAIAAKRAAEDAEILSLDRLAEETEQVVLENERLAAEALKARNAMFAESESAQDLAARMSGAAGAADVARASMGRAGGSTRNLGMAALEGSRALEDLQYGLGGVINNIPSLVMSLGGSAGLTAAISLAVVGIYQLYKHWDELTGIFEEKNPFPQAAHDVDAMKRELDAAKDSLKEMEKAGSGNAAQLEKYNQIRARTAELERKIADEQERQATLKKLLEAPSDEQEGRAKGFQQAVKGRGKETLDTLTQALRQDQEDYIRQQRIVTENAIFDIRQSGKTDAEKAQLVQAQWQRFEALVNGLRGESNRPEKLAEDLMTRLGQGEQGAFDALDRLMRETTITFGDLRQRIDAGNPELKKKADEFWKALSDEVDGFVKDIKQQKAAGEQAAKGFWTQVWHEAQVAVAQSGAAAKAEKATGTAAKKDARADEQADNAQRKAQRKQFDQSGITAQAGATYAAARAQGATSDQAFDLVTQQARRMIDAQQARVPKARRMGEDQRNLLATRMASAGRAEVNERMVGLQGQNLNASEKLMLVNQALNNDLAQQQRRVMDLERQVSGLLGNVNARVQAARNRGRGG